MGGRDQSELDSALSDFENCLKNDKMKEEEAELLGAARSRKREIVDPRRTESLPNSKYRFI